MNTLTITTSVIPKTKRGIPMRFQDRDGEIFQAIFVCGGVLARRQLKEMFWLGMSDRAMEKCLAKPYYNGLIIWPTRNQWRTKPISEPILWLGWKGILWIAGKLGYFITHPANPGENQMRLLEKRLRVKGIHWLREPRWMLLEHDLAVVDFRLAVEKGIDELPNLMIEHWML